jgi:hypothetical protein
MGLTMVEFRDLGAGDGHAAQRGHLLVQAHLVGLFGILLHVSGDQTLLEELLGPLRVRLEKGQVRALGVHLVSFVRPLCALLGGLRRLEGGFGLAHLGAQFFFVQVHQDLALFDPVPIVS